MGRLRGKSEYVMFYKIWQEHSVQGRAKEREWERRERMRLGKIGGGQQDLAKISVLHPRAVGKL